MSCSKPVWYRDVETGCAEGYNDPETDQATMWSVKCVDIDVSEDGKTWWHLLGNHCMNSLPPWIAACLLLWAVPAAAAIPVYRSSGTFTASAGTCTPPMPAGEVADDILLLVVVTENEQVFLTTANGFVQVTNSPQTVGTGSANGSNRVAVYWKLAVGSDASPVVTDVTNQHTCQIHAFSGGKTIGNPWNITAGGNDSGGNDTSALIPGATTTVTDTLVVLIQATSDDSTSTTNCGAVTNANLANITERTDNTDALGLGGGHCLITGEKATAGAYGSSTLTLAAASLKTAISIALEGDTGGGGGGGGTNRRLTLLGVGEW